MGAKDTAKGTENDKSLPGESQSTSKQRVLMAPEQFSGYVPTIKPTPVKPKAREAYQCSISPMLQRQQKIVLSWTISGDYVYFKNDFHGEAWYGFGLNNVSAMGLA